VSGAGAGAAGLPEVGRRGPVGGIRAALRFLRTDGGYHAAALTYYSIFALFPAGALIYALLGVFSAESAIDDVAEELDERGFDHHYVNAVRQTIKAAVTQRSDKALIVVAVSVVAAIYVASQWVRGVRRGLDAVLERPHSPAGLGKDLRDALALVLLFSAALLLQFAGGRIAPAVFGEGPLLRPVGAYLLAAIAGACAYAYVYACVAAPPRPPRTALWAASVATMLLWIAATFGFRLFAERWPGYEMSYGVFATPIVGLIWLWLTNVSVLLGGAFAHELGRRDRSAPAVHDGESRNTDDDRSHT
jgi:membrane protein